MARNHGKTFGNRRYQRKEERSKQFYKVCYLKANRSHFAELSTDRQRPPALAPSEIAARLIALIFAELDQAVKSLGDSESAPAQTGQDTSTKADRNPLL